MDFLKLVQKKEHKTDNKVIVVMVFLVVLIMSTLLFWPNKEKHNLFTYLPDGVSFYYHLTSKKDFSKDIFTEGVIDKKMLDLENVLGDNFLNLQEVLWFQIEGDLSKDNYLLRFSRLPKSFVFDAKSEELDFKLSSPQKNILLIRSGNTMDNVESRENVVDFFDKGISVYWKRGEAPDFLGNFVNISEIFFVGDDILINWQPFAKTKNRFSSLENINLDIIDMGDFLIPKKFDIAFGFNTRILDSNNKDIISDLLKTFFNVLPYYSLNTQIIEDRLLNDTMILQKGDAWVLASYNNWQESILNLIDTFTVEEIPNILSDGTAYIELVATDKQQALEYQVNEENVIQIDDVFIFDIEDKYYLSNSKELVEELLTYKYHLSDFASDCLIDSGYKISDFLYIEDTTSITELGIGDYLLGSDINTLNMISYATGTISGLSVCF